MASPSPNEQPRLLYLSGAPRVSTHSTTEMLGPRSHILGTISGFEELGWSVDAFILGDRFGGRAGQPGSERVMTANRATRFAADGGRLLAGRWHSIASLSRDRPDLVYERMALLQQVGRPWQRRGVPWVLETNGLFWREAARDRNAHLLSGYARRVERSAYRACDIVVAVSSHLRDEVIEFADVDPDKVVVIPNGVDVGRFRDARRSPRAADAGVTIGFVGAVIHWQALDLLFQAVSTLRSSGTDIRLVIAGDGPELGELRELAVELGIDGAVDFRGRVAPDSVPSLLGSVDLAYSGQRPLQGAPMYHSPLKLYEYVAAGLPFVASAYPDAQHLSERTGTGFLFEPDQLESLIHELRRAVEALPSLSERTAQARAYVEQNESWTARVASLLGVVQERFPQVETGKTVP